MTQRVRIVKRVPLNNLLKPTPVFTRDGAERITQIIYDYYSVQVQYDVVWAAPDGSTITSVTQTVTDL